MEYSSNSSYYNNELVHEEQQQHQHHQQEYSSEENSENDDEILENEFPKKQPQQQQHQYHQHQQHQQEQEFNRISIDNNSNESLQHEHSTSTLIQQTHKFEEEYVYHTHPRFFFLITATCFIFALLFTWCWITFTPYTFPWFIYPVAVFLTLALTITIFGARRIQRKLFSFHMWMFIIWNIVLVITNDKTTSFPWSVILLLIWSSGFIIHGTWEYYRSIFSLLTCHTVVYITFCFLIYVIWCYATTRGFPWFIFPIAVWGFILIGHAGFNIYRNSKKRNSNQNDSSPTSVNDRPLQHNQNLEQETGDNYDEEQRV